MPLPIGRYARKDSRLPKPTVLIDSREKTPLVIPPSYKSSVVTLRSCDYTVLGYQSVIGVERKSLDDLFGTLTYRKNKLRFTKQLERSVTDFDQFVLMVQGTTYDVLTYAGRSRGRSQPQYVYQFLFELSLQYKFQVMFTDTCSRQAGMALCRMFDAYRSMKRPRATDNYLVPLVKVPKVKGRIIEAD